MLATGEAICSAGEAFSPRVNMLDEALGYDNISRDQDMAAQRRTGYGSTSRSLVINKMCMTCTGGLSYYDVTENSFSGSNFVMGYYII